MKKSNHERGLAKHCFARAQDESYARIREHTPIYDVDAHLRQQRKNKRRKALLDSTALFCSVLFAFSFFFMGE
ncbi:hypothetical protein [Acinetobacter populi]|uniref:hypothetical protein n=1 Tax=Acinetobacter populi TaxID=1582270 RepID=UPI0011207615|nr:hypothetical protein [Acinetobacter populi]